MMAKLSLGMATIVVVVMASIVAESKAQSTTCINKLIPCLNYLNGTKDVPGRCCDPLEKVIKSDPKCLCSMISNKGSRRAELAGINVNDAQMLPARCGIRVNPLSCITINGSPSTKNSVDKSSSGLLFPSLTFIFATAFSFLLLLCS